MADCCFAPGGVGGGDTAGGRLAVEPPMALGTPTEEEGSVAAVIAGVAGAVATGGEDCRFGDGGGGCATAAAAAGEEDEVVVAAACPADVALMGGDAVIIAVAASGSPAGGGTVAVTATAAALAAFPAFLGGLSGARRLEPS